jgi:UDP-N-acetyl-2-amino-2-deoxyglucuronate dehydrogenase
MKIHKNRILIIGSGSIFKKHFHTINVLKKKFEIIGIVEKNPKKFEILKKNFNFGVFKDLNLALKNCVFDLGCILTDSGSHAKIALKLLNNNKSIIIEKPLAISLKDAEKIVQLEKKKNNLNIFVVKQNRFNIAIQKLKAAINEKRLGKIFLATIRVRWMRDKEYYKSATWRGKWKTDGGVLCNQAIHHIDLLQWLVGDVKDVYCKSSTVSAPIEAEDTAAGILNFKNGALGIVEATTACRPSNLEGSISIMGTKGTVIVGGFSADKILEWQFLNSKKSDQKIIASSQKVKNLYASSHIEFYKFVDEILKSGKKKNFLNAQEAIKSLRIVTALVKSNNTGKAVNLNSNLYRSKLGK